MELIAEDYTLDTIKSIMDCSMGWELTYTSSGLIVVVHVGFIDDGAPFVLPMIGKMGQYDNSPMSMYIHGTLETFNLVDLQVMCQVA